MSQAPLHAEQESVSIVRAVVVSAVVTGWVMSIVFMRRVGSQNPSLLLQGLFAGWVSSPFVCVAVASAASRRWASTTRASLYTVSLLITAVSVAIYGGVVPLPRTFKPAFAYLMVPLASWALIAVLAAGSALIARKDAVAQSRGRPTRS
jgi:hypothetical protein